MNPQISEPYLPDNKVQRAGYNTVLANPQFLALWIAQIFSQFADRAVFVLFVAILTVQATNTQSTLSGAAQMTGWLYLAFTIPAILLSPIAGVYVDRCSHRSVMILSNLARSVCVALVTLPLVAKSLFFDFALAFLISFSSQFFGPAETASIPRLVKREELYAANSLFFTTMMIALGFGFAIGEPIISHIGLKEAPLVVSGLFLTAGLLLLFIKDNEPHSEGEVPWWQELRSGISYILTNPTIFRAIVKITILFSTIITLNIIAVGLAQQVLHIQPFQFGYIVAAAGIGMGLGNFWVAHWGHSIKTNFLVYSGFTGLGLFMCLLGSLGLMQMFNIAPLLCHVHFMSVPLGISMLIGASCALVAIPTQAQLQAAVPQELRGKVFGTQNTAMSAASTIPAVLAGILIDNLPGGVSTTLFILGVPILVMGTYHLIRSAKSVSQI